jgi:transcriptional regulator with XRE-family HTH domain
MSSKRIWPTLDGSPFEPTRLESAIMYRGKRRFEIARDLGVSTSLLDRWERGASAPTMDQVLTISAVLLMPIKYFFGEPLDDIECTSLDWQPFQYKANR